MSQDSIPVAVVGVGHLGRHHARLYASMPGVTLVGIVDQDAERAAAMASEYGCEVIPQVEDLPGRVRAVSVAVPTAYHRAVAEPLLRAGCDVLVEKPIATTLDEADAMVQAAADNDRILMVGHTERFNPAVLAMARAVERPRFFEVHRLAAFTARSTDIDVVLDLMIHDLDLMLALDGTDPVEVDAVGVAALTDKVDIANARIRFASGCVANLTSSRISADPIRRVRVFQARTYMSCDTVQRTVERFQLLPREGAAPEIRHDQLPVDEGEPLGNELSAFIDAVRSREMPRIDGRQGRKVLDLAFRVNAAIEAHPARQ
ncbi:hypothetical protein ABI59_23975 [Acidobacteria bacterium Mor1]|nr:hypothetical protein ABI59_23975 [Acidobacteria bacterium Mor1]